MSAEPSPSSPRPLNPITLVWAGGVALAVIAYAIGPEHVAMAVLDAIERAAWAVSDIVHNLTNSALHVMRAAAIGLIGVFVGLSILSIARTGRGHAALVVIGLTFLMLVWGATGDGPGANTRWMLALFVAAAGAVATTNRLTHGEPGGWRIPGRRR